MILSDEEAVRAVDLVDTLMSKYRMGITPTADEMNEAIDLGINLIELREVVETENGTVTEIDDFDEEDADEFADGEDSLYRPY